MWTSRRVVSAGKPYRPANSDTAKRPRRASVVPRSGNNLMLWAAQRLLVPGSRGERRGDGLSHGCVGTDFGDGRWNVALPRIEVGHHGSALTHDDPALVARQAFGAAISLA